MIRHIPRKTKAILISILASLVLVGGTLGAFLIISNVLDLGVTELTAGQVRLTLLDALPAGVNPGEEMEARFRIENLGDIAITGASLKVRVFTTNGVSLSNVDPSIVSVKFEGLDSFAEQTVALSVVGDNLEGTMLSDWSLSEGYDNEVRVKLTFSAQAPRASYSVEVWVESGAGGSGEGEGDDGGVARSFIFISWLKGGV